MGLQVNIKLLTTTLYSHIWYMKYIFSKKNLLYIPCFTVFFSFSFRFSFCVLVVLVLIFFYLQPVQPVVVKLLFTSALTSQVGFVIMWSLIEINCYCFWRKNIETIYTFQGNKCKKRYSINEFSIIFNYLPLWNT